MGLYIAKNDRQIIPQQFDTYSLVVSNVTPTPIGLIGKQDGIALLVDSYIVSVPSVSVNSVFQGKKNVTTDAGGNQGLEIRPGIPAQFSVNNIRLSTETMLPLDQLACRDQDDVPFVVWDVTDIYLISKAAQQTVSITLYYAPFL